MKYAIRAKTDFDEFAKKNKNKNSTEFKPVF